MSKINIKHLAQLSDIKLSNNEEILYKKQLEKVLDFVSQLSEVKTENNKAKVNDFIDLSEVNDIVKPSLDTENVMKNAVSKHNNYFKVDLILKNKNP